MNVGKTATPKRCKQASWQAEGQCFTRFVTSPQKGDPNEGIQIRRGVEASDCSLSSSWRIKLVTSNFVGSSVNDDNCPERNASSINEVGARIESSNG